MKFILIGIFLTLTVLLCLAGLALSLMIGLSVGQGYQEAYPKLFKFTLIWAIPLFISSLSPLVLLKQQAGIKNMAISVAIWALSCIIGIVIYSRIAPASFFHSS